jgi:hypothetical protein
MCKGDVLDLGLGEAVQQWQAGRTLPLLAEVNHNNGFFSFFASSPSSVELTHGTQHLQATLPHGAVLRMHVVGRKAPENIPWSTISSIHLSKPPRHEKE